MLALTCFPCFSQESNTHVVLGRGQGPELAAIQWARSSNSSTVEMLFVYPHKNSWRPALRSGPEVYIHQNRAFEFSPENPGKVPYELWSKMCRCADPSQQHLIFALPGCASGSDTSASMEMPASFIQNMKKPSCFCACPKDVFMKV